MYVWGYGGGMCGEAYGGHVWGCIWVCVCSCLCILKFNDQWTIIATLTISKVTANTINYSVATFRSIPKPCESVPVEILAHMCSAIFTTRQASSPIYHDSCLTFGPLQTLQVKKQSFKFEVITHIWERICGVWLNEAVTFLCIVFSCSIV